MAAISVINGKIQEEEIEKIIEVYRQIFDRSLESDWVRGKVHAMMGQGFKIGRILGRKSILFNSSQKSLILQAAYRVAAADGAIDASEEGTLITIANALGMSVSQMNKLFSEIKSETVPVQSYGKNLR
ncbi:MAG: TerB family tellurite resistance protein [Cyanobacteria bacterium J06632_22]